MKIKVSELAGAKLDYWVAKAEGRKLELREGEWFVENNDRDYMFELEFYTPHKDWSSAGPLIERELISLEGTFNGWGTVYWIAKVTPSGAPKQGPTPLIAAMRAYVASKFGDEVEVPA